MSRCSIPDNVNTCMKLNGGDVETDDTDVDNTDDLVGDTDNTNDTADYWRLTTVY